MKKKEEDSHNQKGKHWQSGIELEYILLLLASIKQNNPTVESIAVGSDVWEISRIASLTETFIKEINEVIESGNGITSN